MRKLNSRQYRHTGVANDERNAKVWTSGDLFGIFAQPTSDWGLLAYVCENCATNAFEG